MRGPIKGDVFLRSTPAQIMLNDFENRLRIVSVCTSILYRHLSDLLLLYYHFSTWWEVTVCICESYSTCKWGLIVWWYLCPPVFSLRVPRCNSDPCTSTRRDVTGKIKIVQTTQSQCRVAFRTFRISWSKNIDMSESAIWFFVWPSIQVRKRWPLFYFF